MTPNFEYHLKTVLRTRKVADTPDMTPEKHLRVAWSNAKQVLPSKILKIQHRILILN